MILKRVLKKPINEKISEKIIHEIFSFYDEVHPFYDGMKIKEELKIAGAWKKNLQDNRKIQIKRKFLNLESKNFLD